MKSWKGISASVIKWIAMITMLIDHIGAVVVWRLPGVVPDWNWSRVYDAMRLIGRIAFPLYCFLLIEGFLHTADRKKYAGRLLLFAILSEIPFDLAMCTTWSDWSANNVMWTLLLGILMLCGIEWAEKNKKKLLAVPVVAVAFILAEVCNVDYRSYGIAVILLLYISRRVPAWGLAGGCIILSIPDKTELFAAVGAVLVKLYNGKRGRQNKYLFYLFYPVHLLLLWLVADFLSSI